jgi:protein TonB
VTSQFKFTHARQQTIIVVFAVLCICAALVASPSAHTAPNAAIAAAPTDKEIADSPIYKPAPEYPDRALQANVEGTVRVSVTLAPDGHVAKAEVIEADPEGWFEDAALEAIKTWKYRPPRREMTIEVAIKFTLP